MSIVMMDMSSYEIERDDSIHCADEDYGWNPTLALQPVVETRRTLPADMTTLDAEYFLNKMYDYQL